MAEKKAIQARKIDINGEKHIKTMPRRATIPGIEKGEYRSLQKGNIVEVSAETAANLVEREFAEYVKAEKKPQGKKGDK